MRQIAELSHDTLQPMAPGGRKISDAQDEILEYLKETLSEEHAELFGTTVPDPTTGSSKWYTDLDGPIVAFDDATDEQRQAANATLQRLRADIVDEAGRLSASRRRGDQSLGRLLTAALEIPSSGAVHIVGDRPVLSAWGFVQAGDNPAHGVIESLGVSRQAKAADAAARPVEAASAFADPMPEPRISPSGVVIIERAWFSWSALLLWLLFLLLSLVIFQALLSACGVGFQSQILGLRLIDRCPLQFVADEDRNALDREIQRTIGLQSAMSRMEIGLQDQIGRCSVQVTHAEPHPAPGDDFNRRVTEQGGQVSGDVALTLTWDTADDLDLSLQCPGGGTVAYNSRLACGAELDVDANSSSDTMLREPVENIVFQTPPPPGTYHVIVDPYKIRNNSRQPIPFKLRVVVNGESKVIEDVLSPGAGKSKIVSFTIN
jgi:hypothetical protein